MTPQDKNSAVRNIVKNTLNSSPIALLGRKLRRKWGRWQDMQAQKMSAYYKPATTDQVRTIQAYLRKTNIDGRQYLKTIKNKTK